MSESGINLDFDQLLDSGELLDGTLDRLELDTISCQDSFYTLQSTPISPHEGTIKNASMSTRANLKLQLMKQQLDSEARHENNRHVHSQQIPRQTDAIPAPNSSLHSKEVPPHIYEVKTALLNPTKYHVRQSQVRQVEMYLQHDHLPPGGGHYSQSLPVTNELPQYTTSTSAPTVGPNTYAGPDSPLSQGMSSATNSVSEMDDILLSDIISLESVDPGQLERDLGLLEPSLLSQTMPHQPHHYLDQAFHPSSRSAKSATSCPEAQREPPPGYTGGRIRDDIPPVFATDAELHQWHKDRQKKDNHNVIEQRRRTNINAQIKELGTLLPSRGELCKISKHYDTKQNKGTILKASVDYIRKMQRDREYWRRAEEQNRQLESTNRKMLLRIQELEMMMKTSGIQGQSVGSSTTEFLNEMLRTTQPNLDFIKEELPPSSSPCGGVSPGVIVSSHAGGMMSPVSSHAGGMMSPHAVGGASPMMEFDEHMEETTCTLLGNDPMISLASHAVQQHGSRRSSGGVVSMEEAAEMLG